MTRGRTRPYVTAVSIHTGLRVYACAYSHREIAARLIHLVSCIGPGRRGNFDNLTATVLVNRAHLTIGQVW